MTAGPRRVPVAARTILSVAVPVLVAAAFAGCAWWLQGADLNFQENLLLTGPFLRSRVAQHLSLVGWSMAIAVAVGLPVGIVAGKRRNAGTRLVLGVANLGQSVPGLAVLALLGALVGIGRVPAIIALALYSLLPVLRNTAAGIATVDPAVREAALGMGLRPGQVLLRAELPLASPVIFAGLRTAVVLNVGTAALASFIGAGGLGEVIAAGMGGNLTRVTAIGCILTVGVALLADWVVGLAELAAIRRTGRFEPAGA